MPSCNRFVLFSAFASLAILPLMADQIVMKNGDRVTGAVVKKDGNNLTVKADQLGAVVLPWDQVASITTSGPINVVLANGQKAKAPITTSGAMVTAGSLSAGFPDVSVLRNDAEQAAADRLLHPGWAELWAGNAGLGLAGTKGNAEALTFTVGANAARATRTDKTTLYFNVIKSSASVGGVNSQTAQAVRGGWTYNHNLHDRMFVGVFNDYEYDKFQNLNLRFVVGGNLGYHVMKKKRSQLDALGGFDYNHASYFGVTGSPATTTSFAEFMLGDDYSFKLNGNTSLVQSARFFDSMSDTSAYRVNFDVGASTKISKWLTWNLSLSDRYNNRPAAGRKDNDFLYSTGIGITFAR